MGSTISALVISGLIICLFVGIFLEPLLTFFGATEDIMIYVKTYVSIINIGILFLLISTGGSHLI